MNNTATSTDAFVDSTSYSNNGTGVGGGSLVATTTGVLDGAFEFDGIDDNVEVPDDNSLDGMSQLTMSGWVFFEQLPSTVSHDVGLLVKRHSVSPWNSYYFNIINTGGGCPANNVMYVSIKNQSAGDDYKCANTSLTVIQWYYVAATWDGSNIHFYLNGVNDDYGDTSFSGTNVFASDSILYINGDDSGPGRIDGKIDDVRISKFVRSAAWLRAEYYNGTNVLLSQGVEEKGPGPVAYWGFEEGYGNSVADSSSNGHTLTVSNTVWKTDSECKSGKCLYFDGTMSVATTSNSDALNISGSEITLSAWFKPLTQSGKKIILNKGSYAQHWNYGFGLNNTGLLMRHNNGDKTTSNVNLNTNDWHYFTAVYSGGNDYFYVDGVLVESMTDSGWAEQTGTYQLTLGAAFQTGVGYSEFFHGYLDEVKVYNYARTVNQIKNDYNKNFSIALGTNEYASLSDGLVGWWQLDESATTTGAIDKTGNGNTGTYTVTASTTSGKFNRSAVLDGNSDYISVAHNEELNMKKDLSIALWIYPTVIDNDWIRFVEKSDYDDSYSFTTGSGSNRDLAFWFNNTEVIDTDEVLSLNTWQHVALTYNGEYAKIFLNGELVKSVAYSGSVPGNSLPLTFGEGVGSRYFEGQMDEIRIYNRGLSDIEIQRLYEWAPAPVGYWKFDEGIGQDIFSSTASSTEQPGGQGYLGTSVSTEAADPIWAIGKQGSALSFDAANVEQAYIPDSGVNSVYDYTTGDSISLSLWAKPFAFSDNDGLVTKGSANNENYGIELENANPYNRLQFYFRRDDETDWSLYLSNQTLSLYDWSHIAVTYTFGSSTSIKIYIDGVLTSGSWVAGTGAETPDNDDSGILIGKNDWGGEEFTGLIDDVRLYRYIRSPRQIREDMNGSKKNNPIGFWSFDEGEGQTVKDYSGSGYNITLGATTSTGTDDPTRTSQGRFNSGAQFDGSNDYTRASSEVIAYNFGINDFSVSFYSKFTDAKNYGGLLGQGYLDNEIGWGFYYDSTGKVTFQTRNLTNISDVVSNVALNDGAWHHIVGRRENGNLRIYIDGIANR